MFCLDVGSRATSLMQTEQRGCEQPSIIKQSFDNSFVKSNDTSKRKKVAKVDFSDSPCVCMEYSGFLPLSKDMKFGVRLIEESNLSLDMNVRVNCC